MDQYASFFAPANKMLRWGNKGIKQIETAADRFFKSDVYTNATHLDAENRLYVLKLIKQRDVPDRIEELTTVCVMHIKHCIDRAIFAACRVVAKTPAKTAPVNFPWADTKAGSDGILYGPNSKVAPELRPIVLALEPYGTAQANFALVPYSGGDDISRALAKLANRKHTVDLGVTATPITASAEVTIVNPEIDTFSNYSGAWDVMENEIIMGRFPFGTRYQHNYNATFDICFNETGALHRIPVPQALRHFHVKAQTVIETLEREARLIAAN